MSRTGMKFQRIKAYSRRVFLELIRDPLSYVFALGFPIVMLVVMTLVNSSIPAEAGMKIFELESLAPAVYIFGLTFVMLFDALLLSKDREEAFLIRLYTSPMRDGEFIVSYIFPTLVLAVLQGIITFLSALIISLGSGGGFSVVGALASIVVSVPSAVLMILLGLFFGCLFNEKAAPGISSVVISAASLLGGIWMDIEAMGGVWMKICSILPFYHAVKSARMAYSLDFSGIFVHVSVTAVYCAVLLLADVLLFRCKRTK